MNLATYLGSKGYGYQTMSLGPMFNFIVYDSEKKFILKLSCNMAQVQSSHITQKQFDDELFKTVKEQLEIYEEELKYGKEEKARTNND